MIDANNNIELNTKPLSPESLDSAKDIVAETKAPAQESVVKPAETQNQQEGQAPAQEDTKVAEETLPGVGYKLPAENTLAESDETTARLLIVRDKMRRGEIPSNQQ